MVKKVRVVFLLANQFKIDESLCVRVYKSLHAQEYRRKMNNINNNTILSLCMDINSQPAVLKFVGRWSCRCPVERTRQRWEKQVNNYISLNTNALLDLFFLELSLSCEMIQSVRNTVIFDSDVRTSG